MRRQPLSKFDFDQIDNLQPNQSPAAMLCYALCNADSITKRFQRDPQSDDNTNPLMILHDFEYFVRRHTGRHIVEKPIYHDDMPRYWKKAIGHLAWIITEKHDLWDQWQSPYFSLPHNKARIEIDDADHNMIVNALIYVLPAKKLQTIFQSCNATLSAEEYCNGGEIKSRALRVRQTCMTEIERRIGKNIMRNDLAEENMLVTNALSALVMDEITGSHNAAITEFIDQQKTNSGKEFAKITQEFDAAMDKIAARLEQSYKTVTNEFKPLEKIASLPPRRPSVIDNIGDPIDLVGLLIFGEKALVTSR